MDKHGDRNENERDKGHEGQGPKYCLNIEGEFFPWDNPTITAAQIAEIGGWDLSQGVVALDLKTNASENLSPDAVVELRPGQGFCKNHGWRRGLS